MKRGLYIVLAVLVALFMTGCMGDSGKTTSTNATTSDAMSSTNAENTTASNSSEDNSGADTSAARKLKVVSTAFPGFDMVRVIAGDLVENTLLVPVGSDSHTYEPTPQDMKMIMDADILIITGGENDVWVNELMKAEGKKPVIVPMMKYSPILVFGMGHYHENPNGELYESLISGHGHDHDHEGHDHDHGHEGHNHGSETTTGTSETTTGSEGTTVAGQTTSGMEGTTAAIQTTTGSEGEGGDDHEGEGHNGGDHDHGHGHEGHDHAHHHHHHHEADEHVWTSPVTYIAIAKAISNVVIQKELEVGGEAMKAGNEAAYNAHFEKTKTYTANFATLEKEVDGLIQQYQEMRKAATRTTLVMADRFPFKYLATDFELSVYAAFEGCSEDNDVDPQAVAGLIEVVNRDHVPVVLKLKVSDGKIAETVAEATGAKILALQDGHVISPEDWDSGKTYVDMMKENLEVLREALN